MSYCPKCGEKVPEYARNCPECGADLKRDEQSYTTDNGGAGWGLLGFCIPIVGLILYIVYKEEKPYTASAVGSGALVGFIFNVIMSILLLSLR